MRKIILALLMACTITSLAAAQDATTTTITGTVVSATNDALVIDTSTGRMTYKLDSMLDRVKYNDLKPGTQVQVVHKLDSQGIGEVVTDVTVLQAPATPPASTYDANKTAADDRVAASDRLPATASPFATLAFLSLAALLGGLGLRARANARIDS